VGGRHRFGGTGGATKTVTHRTRRNQARDRAAVPVTTKPMALEARHHYEKILQQADQIIETNDDLPTSWKIQKRNEWMIDNSDATIAIWDGKPSGTTKNTEYPPFFSTDSPSSLDVSISDLGVVTIMSIISSPAPYSAAIQMHRT